MSEQTPENRGRDIWARLSQTLKSGAETIVQETKGLTRIGKLKVELMALESERGRKFEDIGRKAYDLRRGGTEFPPELQELFLAVDDTEVRIAEKNAEIERVRAESAESRERAAAEAPKVVVREITGFCPGCGTAVRPEDVYCSKCGARLM